MFEKVNPMHPDKVADRIAGALVDLAYKEDPNPKIAVEVLIGHGRAFVIAETSVKLDRKKVALTINRISGIDCIEYIEVPQDTYLALNQSSEIRCGDNGIFKGCPVTTEQKYLQSIALELYDKFTSDGKFIIVKSNNELVMKNKIIICQSLANNSSIREIFPKNYNAEIIINPLGPWTGGTDVDCGATNRKLGSDMGDAVTGGGLHGKDLSKADITLNIYCHLKAQELGHEYKLCCAIGDEFVDGKPYAEIVEIAREYIKKIGGFEKFAEWGLIR